VKGRHGGGDKGDLVADVDVERKGRRVVWNLPTKMYGTEAGRSRESWRNEQK
jgi:hypothetical protein